jgi:hypothetical protein
MTDPQGELMLMTMPPANVSVHHNPRGNNR